MSSGGKDEKYYATSSAAAPVTDQIPCSWKDCKSQADLSSGTDLCSQHLAEQAAKEMQYHQQQEDLEMLRTKLRFSTRTKKSYALAGDSSASASASSTRKDAFTLEESCPCRRPPALWARSRICNFCGFLRCELCCHDDCLDCAKPTCITCWSSGCYKLLKKECPLEHSNNLCMTCHSNRQVTIELS
jgi:hypothetical protein